MQIRNGIVLAKEGGAVGKMLPVFTIFAGGPLGSGKQWCSWVHRCDHQVHFTRPSKLDLSNSLLFKRPTSVNTS